MRGRVAKKIRKKAVKMVGDKSSKITHKLFRRIMERLHDGKIVKSEQITATRKYEKGSQMYVYRNLKKAWNTIPRPIRHIAYSNME